MLMSRLQQALIKHMYCSNRIDHDRILSCIIELTLRHKTRLHFSPMNF